MSPLDELNLYLRPPGQGIYAVSSGKAELKKFTQKYLQLSVLPENFWKKHLQKIKTLRGKEAAVLLAIPSDAGAGIMRGASHGPVAIRKKFGKAPVFDLGDVITVPHFISDEMLSRAQIQRTQDALYENVTLKLRRQLPVSPIDIAERVYFLLHKINPQIKVLLLGGDHTVAWPGINAVFRNLSKKELPLGILHFDAHTDLLETRLGVKYCFATWAYHANKLIGGSERLLQIGIRSSGKKKVHWESSQGVRQIWADEALQQSPAALANEVVKHFRACGVKSLYVSNDIDGTDARWASACGTPESGGLTREHVTAVLRKLKTLGIPVVGADMVELAPGLSLSHKLSQTSIATAVRYVRAELELLKI